MASNYTSGRFQAFDSSGNPLSFGRLYTYAAGTLNPLATYTTQSGLVPNAVDIELDAAGRASVWLGSASYRMILKNASGTTITDDDNINNNGTSVSLDAFGGDPTGVADSSAAVVAAVAALSARGGVIRLNGQYRLDAQVTITHDQVSFEGDGPRSSAFYVYHDLGAAITVQHASTPGTAYVNGFCMRNVSMRAQIETTQGCLLKLNKVQDVFFNGCSFEDHFGGIDVLGGANIFWDNFRIFSPRTTGSAAWSAVKTGSYFLRLRKDGNGVGPTEMFVSNGNLRRTASNDYIEHGVVINACDGVWFTGCHVMGVDQADVYVYPEDGTAQVSGIKFANCWLDNNAAYGIWAAGNSSALYAPIALDSTDFLSHSAASIFADASATAFEGFHVTGGWVRKAAQYGALLRSGTDNMLDSVDFGACNRNGTANVAAISIDSGTDNVQITGCKFKETAFGVTSASMVGIYITASATGNVHATGNSFRLTAADVVDGSTLDTNSYPGNQTNKNAYATAISGTSLLLTEIGDQFYVTAGLNFDNLTGRWNGRVVRLVFAGASTITHGAGGIRLSGSANMTAKAGDVLTLAYSPDLTDWIEVSRMVS